MGYTVQVTTCLGDVDALKKKNYETQGNGISLFSVYRFACMDICYKWNAGNFDR